MRLFFMIHIISEKKKAFKQSHYVLHGEPHIRKLATRDFPSLDRKRRRTGTDTDKQDANADQEAE